MPGTRYVTRDLLAERTDAWMAAIYPWSRGRTLPALNRAALLVLDLQRYFADPESHAYLPALEAVLSPIINLIRQFTFLKRPVVFTRQGNVPDKPNAQPNLMSHWWRDVLQQGENRAELIAELSSFSADRVLDKEHYSAFKGTDLRAWLAQRACDTVVICGVMTHLCCESTAREAFMVGLQPVVVADGCASLDEALHLGSLRGLAHGFAVVTTAAELQGALEVEDGRMRSHPRATPPPRPSSVEGEGDVRTALPHQRGGRMDHEFRALTPLPPAPDVAVVGAGPSGLAAAIQAKRSGLKVALFDPTRPGGQALTAECIENYPGFPGGISGAALMRRFVAQAREHQLQPYPARVIAVKQEARNLVLELAESPAEIFARAVILATGAMPQSLPINLGDGVVYRVDDLPTVRGHHILIVGGGEAAFDQALLAHRFGAAQVTIAIRASAPRATDLLLKRAKERGINLLLETTIVGVDKPQASDEPARVTLCCRRERIDLPAHAIVVCIGKRPQLPSLPPQVERNDRGEPLADALGRTGVVGLYVVGDARRGPFRQVAIAVGDGVAAAMHAASYLGTGIWSEENGTSVNRHCGT